MILQELFKSIITTQKKKNKNIKKNIFDAYMFHFVIFFISLFDIFFKKVKIKNREEEVQKKI
jgi:hypothetical protein